MSGWWKVAFGLLIGLLAIGVILLTGGPPRGEAIILLPPPSPAPVVVHVAGAVAQPGVFSLPDGSRVRDAIQAAGGLLANADANAINLAAHLTDGSRIVVPSLPPPSATFDPQATLPPFGQKTPTPQVIYPINLNTATLFELESLPEIGPSIAQNIIDYRQQHGPFNNIEEILNVPGIGEKIFAAIRNLITV